MLLLGAQLLAPSMARAGWSRPVALASVAATGPYIEQPLVARDARGDAVIAWAQDGSPVQHLEVCTRAAGAAWSAPVRVSPLGPAVEEASVTMDERGEATLGWAPHVASGRSNETLVVWTANVPPSTSTLESLLGLSDGSWRAPIAAASVTGDVTRTALAAAANGRATAVWVQQAEIEAPDVIETADFSP